MKPFLHCLKFLLYIFVLLFPVLTVCYLLRFDVLTGHDLVYPFGRTFFEPEHGRYLATFINSFFTEIIPETFNIHPNDIQVSFMAPFKGVIIAIICLVFTNTFFLFDKNDQKSFLNKILNFPFLMIYISIFILIFNKNYFTELMAMIYLQIAENMIFFEYPTGLIFYALFFSVFGYYFVTNKSFSGRTLTFLILSAFAAGLTVEPLNLPIFVCLGIFAFYFLIQKMINKTENIITDTKSYKTSSPLIYISFFAGLICYYIRPSMHLPDYGEKSFIEYICSDFLPYLKIYLHSFIGKNSIFFIITFILLLIALTFLRTREKKTQAAKMLFLFLSATAGF